MGKDLKAWIAACIPCRQKKSHSIHKRVGKMGHVVVQEPFQTWSMDIVGPLPKTKNYGHDHIITFIDHFTNFPVAVAVAGTPTAETCAEALHDLVISMFGCPTNLLTDRGTQFTSKLFQHVCKRLGIKKLQTTAYNPACNGKNEKLHLYLQTAMHAFVNQKHTDWDRYLNSALMAYRVAPLARIGFSPAYLALGVEPRLPFDVIYGPKALITDDVVRFRSRVTEELREAFELVKQLREKDRKQEAARFNHPPRKHPRKDPDYQKGSLVLLRVFSQKKGRARKFTPRWNGPFRVVEKLSPLTYSIETVGPEANPFTVNVRRLLPYKPWKPRTETINELFPGDFGLLPKVRLPRKVAEQPAKKKRKVAPTLPNTVSRSRYGRIRTHRPLFKDGIVTGFSAQE